MAYRNERSSRERLHYFTLPDNGLKWGVQRQLRCMKLNPNSNQFRSSSAHRSTNELTNSDHRVNEDNSRVDLDDEMRIPVVDERGKGKAKVSEDDCNENRPVGWNLRTRRSACKAPQGIDIIAGAAAERAGIDSRLRGGMEHKTERPKFSFALSKQEIEDDFLAITGAKPPRKPKRRPKALQRKLNDLVPGFWLGEVTTETYKVDDNPQPRKGSK